MKLVYKYLKPYSLLLILCLMLLLGQAFSELYLPNLMSDIVDSGIMRSGVERGAPEVISAKGIELIKPFLPSEKVDTFLSFYDYKPVGSDSQNSISDKYPGVSETDYYLIFDLSSQAKREADDLYADSAYALVLFLQDMMAQQQGESGENLANDPKEGINNLVITELYGIIPMLQSLPTEVKATYISKAQDNHWLSEQISAALSGLYYKELGADLSDFQYNYILFVGLKMLGVAFLSVLAAITVGFVATIISSRIARKMRRDVFAKVNSFAEAEYDRFSTASLITRSTNDIQQVQMLIMMGIRMMLYAPIMGIGGVVMALKNSVSMSWIIAVAVVFLLGVIMVLMAVAMPKFKILQKLIDRLNLVSRENLSGLMVIRAFGNEDKEEARFEMSNADLRDTSRFVQRSLALMMPIMMLIMNTVSLTVVWVGAKEIAASSLQIGDMMAFTQYTMQIIMSFLMISMMFIMVPRAMVSAARISEVLNNPITIKDPETPVTKEKIIGKVEFLNVCFRYENAQERAIEGISFTAHPGQTTAFIGATGSGKSTLVKLIPRFYDVTQGSIYIDETDIRDYNQEFLRDNIGYVPQKGMLFSGTIESNTAYGKEDATKEEILLALEVAQATEFVSSRELGIDSEISQGGVNVSGGQKQRLSIARALVKKPPIYIFDDSFSALDFKTDAALRHALKEYTGDSTVLIVAQRVSTIMNAEQIIVLDDGKMVGKGTHGELLSTCPEYREIAESQLSAEELA